jgi:hypothetical protein
VSQLAPIDNPEAYPGAPLPGSGVLTSADMWGLDLEFIGEAPDPVWPARSPWRVARDGRDVDELLADLGAEPMAARVPVLAIGSNASAAQLRRKFAQLDHWAVPVTLADVTGLGVAYSAHVSRPGYVPWAPYTTGDTRAAQYRITWLTTSEVDVLDATEPNYRPMTLSGDHRVWLESGQDLGDVKVYAGRWGVVADADGRVIPAGGQREALTLLAVALGADVDHVELAASAEAREQASQALRTLAVSDGFTALTSINATEG